MKVRHGVVLSALLCCLLPDGASAAGGSLFVEFLWEPRPADALARQQTLGFVIDGRNHHQVCIAALAPEAENRTLRLDVFDAHDELVSSMTHDDFKGPKQCYDAQFGSNAHPGEWRYQAFLDGVLSGEKTIQVARTLAEAPFYQPSSVPYVLGRPNYDPRFAPETFKGRLVWIMEVNEAGTVTHVEVETAEGVGEQMKDRAIAAGYMSMFPPDPSRTGKPLKYRRELKFEPDKR